MERNGMVWTYLSFLNSATLQDLNHAFIIVCGTKLVLESSFGSSVKDALSSMSVREAEDQHMKLM